jgi:DNA processing protein
MLARGGTLISELPGKVPVKAYHFLERNRLIAAFSAGTVVIEASWRSGAISTANHALNLNRQLGVVPGAITNPASAGSHQLIRECNATLITCAQDVDEMCSATFDPLKSLTHANEMSQKYARQYDDLTQLQRDIIYEFYNKKTQTAADLATALEISASEILGELAKLQLSGHIASAGAGKYQKVGAR